jgi:hypothetical protein
MSFDTIISVVSSVVRVVFEINLTFSVHKNIHVKFMAFVIFLNICSFSAVGSSTSTLVEQSIIPQGMRFLVLQSLAAIGARSGPGYRYPVRGLLFGLAMFGSMVVDSLFVPCAIFSIVCFVCTSAKKRKTWQFNLALSLFVVNSLAELYVLRSALMLAERAHTVFIWSGWLSLFFLLWANG